MEDEDIAKHLGNFNSILVRLKPEGIKQDVQKKIYISIPFWYD